MIMTKGLREALIDLGLAAEWERQGEARGEARGEVKGKTKGKIEGEIIGIGLAVDLFKKGYTPDEIERMLADGSLSLGNEK
jgi:hypothetical protein